MSSIFLRNCSEITPADGSRRPVRWSEGGWRCALRAVRFQIAAAQAGGQNCCMSKRSEHDAGSRRYTDAEVRLLLEQASRVQGQGQVTRQPQGLTLAELEEVAAEAEIDVARLREAAHALDVLKSARPAGAAARLAGAPLRIDIRRILPFEVDESELEGLIGLLGSATDDAGEPRFVGRAFTWSASTNSGRRLNARVTPQRGSTSVELEERYGELAGGLFGGILGGVGGGVGLGAGGAVAGIVGSAALAVAIPAVVIGGSYAACRMGFGAYVRRRARRLNAICDEVARHLADAHGERSRQDSISEG